MSQQLVKWLPTLTLDPQLRQCKSIVFKIRVAPRRAARFMALRRAARAASGLGHSPIKFPIHFNRSDKKESKNSARRNNL